MLLEGQSILTNKANEYLFIACYPDQEVKLLLLSQLQPLLLLENWVGLWVGVQPTNTTKPKIRRRKDLLLLAASKENTWDLSQSSVSQNSKSGEVLR